MTQRSFKDSPRGGISLVEVIMSMALLTMLMVPLFSMLGTSNRIWQTFHSPHQSVIDRTLIVRSISEHLQRGISVDVSNDQDIRFDVPGEGQERIFQSGQQIRRQHGGETDVLYQGLGQLSIREIASDSEPTIGTVIEVALISPDDEDHTTRLTGRSSQQRIHVRAPN